MTLRALPLAASYTPDSCPDLIGGFYAPALAAAVRYDRATYSFSANGLAAAAAGIAGLLRNGGRIRLICDKKLDAALVQAIIRGRLQARELLLALTPPEDLTRVDDAEVQGKANLELLTWLVKNDRLEVKIALHSSGIFHPKIGIIADAAGNRIAFGGSVNETLRGWAHNYESLDVFTSWQEESRVRDKERDFANLWAARSDSVVVIPIPEDYTEYLQRLAPAHNPALPPPAVGEPPAVEPDWMGEPAPEPETPPALEPEPAPEPPPALEPEPEWIAEREDLWRRIYAALAEDPATTAATVSAQLWPHQENFRQQRVVQSDQDRLLIADEVGLGKTIQAGILLKTRLNQGRLQRLLILTPKSARRQWQEELRRKFNISVPILERAGGGMTLQHPDGRIEPAPAPAWAAPRVIVSYAWLRRHAAAFLESDPAYDLVVVDEAHHARFEEVNNPQRRRPNEYLKLLRSLAGRTRGLLLLTATPMQINEVELWALLQLLQPEGWDEGRFRAFYDAARELTPDWWRTLRDWYRELTPRPAGPPADRIERLLWNDNEMFVAAQLTPELMQESAARMRQQAPPKGNMSRHTRELLRHYRQTGLIALTVPRREVRARSIQMNPAERQLYEEIDELVRQCYAGHPALNRPAVGFIMTTYRKRLGSSPYAYAQTIRNHLARRENEREEWRFLAAATAEELDGEDPDAALPGAALPPPQRELLAETAERAMQLRPDDTKYRALLEELAQLEAAGHRKIIIFTQFRDTQLYLENRLTQAGRQVTCLSGQDATDGGPPREERIKALIAAASGLLLCTETAAESLNLQFCTAMVNYDIPWNPMTLEQRIGRIDRIGQQRERVDIVHLFYADTAEYDAYQAMEERLRAIQDNVGAYRPILQSGLERIIREAPQGAGRQSAIAAEIDKLAALPLLNLDLLNSEITALPAERPQIGMDDLTRILNNPRLLPAGWTAAPAGDKHWQVTGPDAVASIVTTDRAAHEYAAARVEWWGPGSPAFPNPPPPAAER